MTRIHCYDWRTLPSARVAPLLAAEIAEWRAALHWDLDASWAVVEPARVTGRLPGFVAVDNAGRSVGWTMFVEHRGTLQVASLVASSPAVTDALVREISMSAPARRSAFWLSFTRDRAPGLRASFEALGFAVEPYRYLSAPTAAPDDAVPSPAGAFTHAQDASLRWWRPEDVLPIARVFEAAYRAVGGVRPFAPDGHLDEWNEYARKLVTDSGCGRFLPAASFVAREEIGGREHVVGVVVTTVLGSGTAHIAQVAVHPAMRGRRLGRRLVAAASAAAHAHGYREMTLLVASGNVMASALYSRLGFTGQATFIAGVNRHPPDMTAAAAPQDTRQTA